MDNNYSNIIAPSDGVRRFLCKTSVLFAGIIAAAVCYFAFRMNMLEGSTLGHSLRSKALCAAYVMLPLGMLTSAIFARIRKMGLAFSMISLVIAMLSSLMLLLNSLASLMREGRLLGISGSLFEFLTFGAFFAMLVNLVMSCMDFKILPVIGGIGSVVSAIAMIINAIRTTLSYSALSFALNPEFDWNNLANTVDTDKMRYHAEWVFRSIPRSDGTALEAMFRMRFLERTSACVLYCVLIMIFLKYQKEMKAFNKLLEHASEYVEIPTARIYPRIIRSGGRNDGEQISRPTVKRTGQSVKSRLRDLSNMAKARENGMDITEMADDFDARRIEEKKLYSYSPEMDDMDYPDEAELTEEERFIMERRKQMARRQDEYGEDERPRQRRRQDEFGEDERPRQRRRQDEFGEDERPRQRRRQVETGYDERRENRRPQQKRELTEQEKYLMEERRKRAGRMRQNGSAEGRFRNR